MVIFFDTYAIIEIAKGSRKYRKYAFEMREGITSILNLMEVYFVHLKDHTEEEANRAFNVTKQMITPIDDDIIKEAMKFKLLNQRKRMSYADCIGYCTALRNNAVFLTGDSAFQGLEGVEFVK